MMSRRFWLLSLLLATSCANCPCATTQEACVGDSDCVDGKICRSEVCVARGAYCLTDDECPPEQACISNYCEVGTRTVRGDAGVDAGIECDFGEARCLDSTTIETCELGRLATVDCSRNGLTCDEGFCRPAPCVPDGGATRCLDLTTQQSCGEDAGMVDCGDGEICWNGACARASGEPCTADTECAGGFCHCKDAACSGSLANGYCSQLGCNDGPGTACPITDVCMGLASAGNGQANICGRKAGSDCPSSTDGLDPGYAGPFKRFLPIPDPENAERYTFGDAVCFDRLPAPTGAACAAPTECIGGAATGFAGQCLTFDGAVAGGYCSHACDQTHPCAPGSACAHRASDPAAAGICVLMCGQQRRGLATCDRAGLSCQDATTGGVTILDGREDALGYCLP